MTPKDWTSVSRIIDELSNDYVNGPVNLLIVAYILK